MTSQVLQPGLWVVGSRLRVTITAIYWTHSQESAWRLSDKTRMFVTCDEAEGAKFRTLGPANKVVRWILGGCTVCGHWEIKTEIPDEF